MTPLDLLLLLSALVLLGVLLHPAIRCSRYWRATVTPLASIIGSGFLVVAPLLADIAGTAAVGAMGLVVVLAYAIGAAVRYNIAHAEPLLAEPAPPPFLLRAEHLGDLLLGLAYILSVAFYVRLLASFVLEPFALSQGAAAQGLTTAILAFTGLTGLLRGLHGLEFLEELAVSVKLAIIATLLFGLAQHDFAMPPLWPVPDGGYTPVERLRMLAGILLVVQGFETSRYLGEEYPREMRIRSMRLAQLLSGAIYLVFIALVTPMLGYLPEGRVDETAIITITRHVAMVLPVMLIVAAVMSQFSAAVADTLGSGGLLAERTGGWLSSRRAYALITALSIALIWLANIFEIITYASQAFAAYYLVQSATALWLARRRGERARAAAFALLAVLLLTITLFARPVAG